MRTTDGAIVGGARAGSAALHPDDCVCGRCDSAPRDCPYPGCWATGADAPAGVRKLGVHIAWTHKRRRRNFTQVVIPSGTGWLAGVLRDPRRMAGLHLESLPRFARWLNEAWEKGKTSPPTMRRRRRIQVDGHRADAAALLARSPNEPYTLPVRLPQVPAALGLTMLDLAHESNVPLRYVTVALLCYGVEMLAKELRATSHAPYPRIPSSEKPPGA